MFGSKLTSKRGFIGAALICGETASAASAHATGAVDMQRALQIGELVIPDLRLEFGEHTPTALVLSAPFHVFLNGAGHGYSTPRSFWLTAFLEPQLRTRRPQGRALLGVRAWLPLTRRAGVALLTEAAGVAGMDGSGFTGGIGTSGLETGSFGASFFGAVYRYTLTTEGRRHDVSLDLLTIPF